MKELLKALLSSDIGERKQAVEQIINEKPVELKSELLKIVESGPSYAKAIALQAYSKIISKEEVEGLLVFTKNKDWHIRLEALKGVASILGKDSVDYIKPFLLDRSHGVRSEVQGILSKFNIK
ncbi:HEAT repeat domain-containing protein [Fictibacillus phosphorivorans]|uniref:HEAT repeat domain-containing protein n=1 Tax=Fictibacillus phosphorivorans TaxID=1221500 RepID=UPI00129352C7|nr:hypothetical protein [Fictibacillus phosphorivorans]MQR94194.1 hypothetical protein [Fictibacillus phosphorivorans]